MFPGRFTYDACDAVAYQSDFRNDDDDGYFFHGSTGGVSYCDGTALLGGYNKLDLSDMVSKLVELPLHTSMKVRSQFGDLHLYHALGTTTSCMRSHVALAGAFPCRSTSRLFRSIRKFVQVIPQPMCARHAHVFTLPLRAQSCRWDSEYAYFYMDHATKWSQQFSGGATQACGSSSSGWHETFVEKSFTVSHFSPFTWLQWQSALSSAGTDESWGLANVKVRQALHG